MFNHTSDEVLQATLEEIGWELKGSLETCLAERNSRLKHAAKTTEINGTVPCERLI